MNRNILSYITGLGGLLVFFCQSLYAQNDTRERVAPPPEEISFAVKLSEGAAALFKDVKCKLSDADKNLVYDQAGFILGPDKKSFILNEANSDQPFQASVFIVDLNNDQVEEVFISYGNSFTSGNTGADIILFVKSASAVGYQKNLGFPGLLPDILPAPDRPFPDLVIGGPGFSFPVYSWDGRKYRLNRELSEQALLKLKLKNVADLSH